MGESNENRSAGFHIDCPMPGCLYSSFNLDPQLVARHFKAHIKSKHPSHYSEFLKGEQDATNADRE